MGGVDNLAGVAYNFIRRWRSKSALGVCFVVGRLAFNGSLRNIFVCSPESGALGGTDDWFTEGIATAAKPPRNDELPEAAGSLDIGGEA